MFDVRIINECKTMSRFVNGIPITTSMSQSSEMERPPPPVSSLSYFLFWGDLSFLLAFFSSLLLLSFFFFAGNRVIFLYFYFSTPPYQKLYLPSLNNFIMSFIPSRFLKAFLSSLCLLIVASIPSMVVSFLLHTCTNTPLASQHLCDPAPIQLVYLVYPLFGHTQVLEFMISQYEIRSHC